MAWDTAGGPYEGEEAAVAAEPGGGLQEAEGGLPEWPGTQQVGQMR